MENSFCEFPRSNVIFRDQPNYKYFSKTFEDDPCDPLFLTLNDVDIGFLQPEQIADKRGFDTFILTDPRTKQPMKQYVYDHTQEDKPRLFRSPKCSALNKAQHSVGVRIVKARQEGLEVSEDEFLIWHRLEQIRLRESQEFSKFVYAHNQTNKEAMYTPARKVLDQYKKWYESKCKTLLTKYPAETYNTHLGLPHVKVCRAVLKEQWADIIQVTILKEQGEKPKWDSRKKLSFFNFKRSLDAYVDDYIISEDLKESLEDEMKVESLKIIQQEDPETPMYYIPLESLLFLLTSGDYCDLPMEVIMDIKEHETDADGEKYIIMDSPLPARHLGWHTYKQVVEHASVALLSLSTNSREEQQNVCEIKATLSKESEHFPATTIEEYMKTCSLKPNKKCKFSKTLSKWQLKVSEKDAIKHIYTTTNTSPHLLGAYSLKLEYKPTFGCELMTKYELLNEWFKLKLQQSPKSICYRLDINNFQTCLKESQSLPKLELLLANLYHVSMPQLLSNLYEFLSLLSSMPCGHYLLRYNPKFKDKLMLCKPSLEITQNTIHLHQLLRTEPSELLFMSQQNYLPIADDLCSRVHMAHNTLPCTFAPTDKTFRTYDANKNQDPFKLINDKEKIVEKAKNKRMLESKSKPRFVTKNRKRKKARKRRAAEKTAADKEREELEREMLIDEQILGF